MIKITWAGRIVDSLFPSRRMRRDWDARARQDAQHYIACGTSETEEAFWRSGEVDLANHVLRDIELGAEASVLEIGCGLGRLLRPLSARVKLAIGVDISNEMIEQGRRALRDLANVRLLQTDGTLRFVPDASVDFVFSFIVFQHIPTRRAISRYFRKAARVLRGGGLFRFQVDGRPRQPDARPDTWVGVAYEPEELKRELEPLGFEILDSYGEGTHYLWVTARRKEQRSRPSSRAVRFNKRPLDRRALEALLGRMGAEPAKDADEVLAGRTTLRRLADRFLAENQPLSPEQFVRRAYEVFLHREADQGGLAFYVGEIEKGIPRENVIDTMLASAEFAEKHRSAVGR